MIVAALAGLPLPLLPIHMPVANDRAPLRSAKHGFLGAPWRTVQNVGICRIHERQRGNTVRHDVEPALTDFRQSSERARWGISR